jgi:hypothetical protein
MKSERNPTGENQQSESLEFSISRFHIFRHAFAFILAAGLCISLIMSELSYRSHVHSHQLAHLKQMIVPYMLIALFVGAIIITNLLAVRKIKMSADGIAISNLFWQEKLAWQDLQAFTSPVSLRFAWIKTKHCLYLLAKSEFKDWNELEKLLQKRLTKH